MKFLKLRPAKFFSAFWLILALAVFNAAFVTGCGKKTDAADKKAKAKKEKEADEEEDASKEKDGEEEEEEETEKKDKKKDSAKEDSDEKKKSDKETAPDAEKIWADLMEGNKRFVEGKHTSVQLASIRKGLIAGQKPKVIILGCADSRVPPELLFDKNLGDLFVIRVAGNVADPVTLGSIEYAVEHLHSNLIVVLGHESCGAVAAALSDEEMPTRNLAAIVDRIKPAFEDSKTCPLGGKNSLECVELNVKHSESDLLAQSSIIKKAKKEGLAIIKAVYKLDTGEVSRLE